MVQTEARISRQRSMIEAITAEIQIESQACNSNVITGGDNAGNGDNQRNSNTSIDREVHLLACMCACVYVQFRAFLVETRLITDDQIMAINSSSAMDPFACKLVPFPAEELSESNLSPQVRGRPLSVIQVQNPYSTHIGTRACIRCKRVPFQIGEWTYSTTSERKCQSVFETTMKNRVTLFATSRK